MQKYQRSIRRERSLVEEAIKEGKGAYLLRGRGPFQLVTIDSRTRQVTFIQVKSSKGSSFRIDRDIRSYPEFVVMERTVTYDGKVKA